MATQPLTTNASAASWNKKQSISDFVNSYQYPFEMKEDAIDLREMSKNYPSGVIPLHDIHAGICSVLDPTYSINIPPEYDPSTDLVSPRFAYVNWKDMYLWPIFQRDVACNHVEKIFKNFDPTCILVACAIKLTLRDDPAYGPEGKTVYCLWDGHHTTQVCKLKNYSTFPLWYIDIDHIPDEVIIKKQFGCTDADRIKYGIYLAGTNMRMINLTVKRPLDPYDDFLIGVETFDPEYMSIMSILKKNNCVVKRRKSAVPGALTQIKAAIQCYRLTHGGLSKGTFFDRALSFHRKTWPGAALALEIFRPMTMFYHACEVHGSILKPDFDDELGNLLATKVGDVETVHQLFKASFVKASRSGQVTGVEPKNDAGIVLAAIINFYRQNAGPTQSLIPGPSCQWLVDIQDVLESSNSTKQPAASKISKYGKSTVDNLFEDDDEEDSYDEDEDEE